MGTHAARLGRAAMFVASTALVTAAAAAGCGPCKPPNHQKPYGAPPADPIFV